jgi:polyhydroxyalkanoate synthesis repressor PhaR
MPKTTPGQGALLVKRHGNRRLYDTESSAYVSSHELAEIIRAGRDVQVVDSKTKEDITKQVLTQIILDEEKHDRSVLPVEFLFQLIRQQERTVQDFFENYLALSLETYAANKRELDARFREWMEMGTAASNAWQSLVPAPPKREK